MGLCWPIQIPPVAKSVLMSLADQANDQGACWPSLPGIVERVCFGRTAVIEAIKWLEEAGYIAIDKVGGRTNRYTLNMGRLRQREIEQPVRQPDPSASRTGRPAALPPVRQPDEPVRQAHPNRQEPSVKPKEKRLAPPTVSVLELVAAGFHEKTAAEFIDHKARLKAPLTDRAWKDHQREAAKAGWSVVDAAEKVMAKSWKGFEAKYVASDPVPPSRQATGVTVPPAETTEEYIARMARERNAAKARATPPPASMRDLVKRLGVPQ
jgi:hypothetical protein